MSTLNRLAFRFLVMLGAVLTGLTLLNSSVLAQGVCPIKTVRLHAVRGIVVENLPGRVPVTNVLVELRLVSDDERVVSSFRTDESGLFRFGPMKKGQYALDFRNDVFGRYRLIVKTRGSDPSTPGMKGSSVVVMLGPDCFKTEVILGK